MSELAVSFCDDDDIVMMDVHDDDDSTDSSSKLYDLAVAAEMFHQQLLQSTYTLYVFLILFFSSGSLKKKD